MTCAYMPDGSQFNGRRSILSEECCGSLEVGDILDTDELPLLWRGRNLDTDAAAP